MVIDDDYGISNLLYMALTEHGYYVITAPNGSAALNTLNHCLLPSLILTDYSMPVLNGCQFIEQASALKYLEHVPILMMTGSNIADLKLPTTHNFKGVISKPFNLNQMLEMISSHLLLDTYYSPQEYVSIL